MLGGCVSESCWLSGPPRVLSSAAPCRDCGTRRSPQALPRAGGVFRPPFADTFRRRRVRIDFDDVELLCDSDDTLPRPSSRLLVLAVSWLLGVSFLGLSGRVRRMPLGIFVALGLHTLQCGQGPVL